ncbi:coenzyme Q biosynthesis protein Coq4-domain-containing protein [Multifurca ochricompacta]|uniref:4-hydroxy-3-methoxy-5-polyprenylbenzoate decarboxylase n=1 Tax=Multifurca ochricompacta TaxID=376703 RepID=A0AAD4QRD6_9AGAM|nr:coenzyme Q biosynthesis protein Coq4-domain-containing protein [Multifurca ochricompacta]
MSLLTATRSRTLRQSLRLLGVSSYTLRVSSPRHTRSVKTEPAYPEHIPLNSFENAFLAVGSAFMSLADPRRADMVAALGETTAGPVLPRLLDHMLESEEGCRILKERPRINTNTIDMAALARLPEGTFGHTYVTWLERCGVTPDTRDPRYRECHDFYHALCGLPVSVEYELALKVFEFANLGLPSAALSVAAVVRLNAAKRERFLSEYVPWALRCGSVARSMITVYWEERWSQDLGELKKELGVWDPPPPKWRKPLSEAKDAAARRTKAESNSQMG